MARKKSGRLAAQRFRDRAEEIAEFALDVSESGLSDQYVTWAYDFAIIRLYREFEHLMLEALVVARSESHAEGATCDKVRDDAVGEQLVGLYSCTLTGVPPQYRPAGSFDNPTLHYCFGFANDTGVNVTLRFGSTCRQSGAPQSEAVVRVYFCTADTCARAATKKQMGVLTPLHWVSFVTK